MQRCEETAFHEFLRTRIVYFRGLNRLSGEKLAEYLHVSPRSYYAQEHGKQGFSAPTLAFYLFYLSETERTVFFDDLREFMEGMDIPMPLLEPGPPRGKRQGKDKKAAPIK